MPNVIRIKRRASGAPGAPTTLQPAEVAFNEVDNSLWYGFGAAGTGGTATTVIGIGGSGLFATLSSAQTVTGAKTFSGGLSSTTPLTADNSTTVATTAYVKAQGYITTNQNITVSGDASGTGSTDISLTLATMAGLTAGTYTKVTVNTKGLITAASALVNADIISALGFTPVNTTAVGAANGVASLDATGKLSTTQIPASLVGAVVYQGTWNASTNTPALTSGTGTKGTYYKVSVAGATTIDGIGSWNPGDTIIFDGTTWDKIDGIANEILSVAGRTGVVTLAYTDISGLGTLATVNTVTTAQGGTGLTAVLTGLVKGNGTVYSAAVVDTDYLSPASVLDGGTF